MNKGLALALVGKNISHSLSPKMYKKILKDSFQYHLLDFSKERDIPSLGDLFSKYALTGLSITSPYKLHFLCEVTIEDPRVKEINIINCIKKQNDTFLATNTDLLATEEILKGLIKNYSFQYFILLGSGPMSHMSQVILKQLHIPFLNLNRKEHGPLENLDLRDFPNCLVLNACSRDFVFRGELGKNSVFWDYNYSFSDHEDFFRKKKQHVTYIDGQEMLYKQAKFAAYFWMLSTQ